jgi:hypothetical protein
MEVNYQRVKVLSGTGHFITTGIIKLNGLTFPTMDEHVLLIYNHLLLLLLCKIRILGY